MADTIARLQTASVSQGGRPADACGPRPPHAVTERAPVAVVILTYNEEQNLPTCLASVAGWAEALIVVDSGSTDRTREIAESFGAVVLSHPFETHALQWEWALSRLPEAGAGDCAWVLGLDADQAITPELAGEISSALRHAPAAAGQVNGYFIKRRQVFRGRWIRHGGYYPKYLLKLFRRDAVFLDRNDLVDHHFYVKGRTEKLACDLIERNRKEDDIAFWVQKHVRYATSMALEEARRDASGGGAVRPAALGNPDEKIAWLKARWRRLPLFVRPFLYFFYRYFLRLGFLDGREGLIFHFLQACWFRFLVDVNLDQLRREGQRGGVSSDPPARGTHEKPSKGSR